MKIILESSALLHTKTGIGRYNLELAKGLENDSSIEVDFFVRNELIHSLKDLQKKNTNFTKNYPKLTKPIRIMKNYIKKKYLSSQCNNSIFHAPNYFLPECTESGIITVHDLSIFKYPETHPKERIVHFEKNFLKTLEKTKHIITDSKAMKQEIMEYLAWPENKISAIHLGVSSKFAPKKNINHSFLAKYQLRDQGYSLCVSTIEPRKNIDKLLNTYQQLPILIRKKYPLILIGANGWLYEAILVKIEKAIKEGWLIRPGFVSEEELHLFYSHSRLFIYPSEYEGFGLPIAEAMASGIPIITSNKTSLPEVANNAGLVINPENNFHFLEAIKKALEDEDWRKKAKTDGIKVSSRYNWQKCVKNTIDIYKQHK